MNPIQQILHDFYQCCNVNIQFIDENIQSVEGAGNGFPLPPIDYHKEIIPLKKAEELLLANGQYIAAPFRENHYQQGFFLAGPFQDGCAPSLIKPTSCAPYLKELLDLICRRVIQNDQEQNPHIMRALQYMEENYSQDIGLKDVSEILGINMCYFCSLFKSHIGASFSQHLTKIRIEKSKNLLTDTAMPIIDVAFSVGYNNHNYFSVTFKRLVGVTPSIYRKNNSSFIQKSAS